jgi:hypothetical protein
VSKKLDEMIEKALIKKNETQERLKHAEKEHSEKCNYYHALCDAKQAIENEKKENTVSVYEESEN